MSNSLIIRTLVRLLRKIGLINIPTIDPFRVSDEDSKSLAISAENDLERIFYAHDGRIAHKWIHYLELYDRHFTAFRSTAVRILEIGVQKGGSLEIWRKYFGENATIYGLDNNPACADRGDPPTQIRIGSQDDAAFLRSIAREMGSIDIVLDDGSHIGRHQITSFKTLFPLLREGGLYVIEDVHTSYWRITHEGGYRRRGTAIEFVKSLIDDLHYHYHSRGDGSSLGKYIGAIHFYDSIVFIEKKSACVPGHVKMGNPTLS